MPIVARFGSLILPLFCLIASSGLSQTPATDAPVKVLVITGGHEYEEEPFADVFRSMKKVTYTHAVFGVDAEKKLKPEEVKNYDVLVFYDMNQNCQPYLADMQALFEVGKGVVFLHHALGSCAEITEYGFMVGGHARFGSDDPTKTNTKYLHDTSYRAHIEDPTNPITAGMSDFDVHDEVYSNYFVSSNAHILLTTDNPNSGRQLAWTWNYKNSRVVYIELGHNHVTYENPNYRRMVERAILWVNNRLSDATAQGLPDERGYRNLGCTSCYQGDARGGRGPDLSRSTLWARNDAEQHLLNPIQEGSVAAGMPSFAEMASGAEIEQLVKCFARQSGQAAENGGDVNAGRNGYKFLPDELLPPRETIAGGLF